MDNSLKRQQPRSSARRPLYARRSSQGLLLLTKDQWVTCQHEAVSSVLTWIYENKDTLEFAAKSPLIYQAVNQLLYAATKNGDSVVRILKLLKKLESIVRPLMNMTPIAEPVRRQEPKEESKEKPGSRTKRFNPMRDLAYGAWQEDGDYKRAYELGIPRYSTLRSEVKRKAEEVLRTSLKRRRREATKNRGSVASTDPPSNRV